MSNISGYRPCSGLPGRRPGAGDRPLAPGQVEVGPGGCPPPCYRGERCFKKHTRRESTPPSGDWGRRFFVGFAPGRALFFSMAAPGIFYYTFVPKSGIIKPREYRGNAAESPVLPGITAEEAPPGGQRRLPKMFQPGDFVVYGSSGVCRVIQVGALEGKSADPTRSTTRCSRCSNRRGYTRRWTAGCSCARP